MTKIGDVVKIKSETKLDHADKLGIVVELWDSDYEVVHGFGWYSYYEEHEFDFIQSTGLAKDASLFVVNLLHERELLQEQIINPHNSVSEDLMFELIHLRNVFDTLLTKVGLQ